MIGVTFESTSVPSYRVGDALVIGGDLIVLAQVGAGRVVALDVASWNRWEEPVPVKSCHKLTAEEVSAIVGGRSFERVARKVKVALGK